MSDNKKVSKANIMIESDYTVNLVAQRVVILAIIEARDQGSMSAVGGIHRIKAVDYEKHFGCDKTTAYRSLKSACESLYESKYVWKSIDECGREKINHSSLVQRASYCEGGGYIEIMFGNDVIPHITRLSEQYTEYELKQIKNLNSTYALRLFEILMQWSSVGKTPVITMEKLRSCLGVEGHQYKLMSDFKKRVLDHALTEINEHTNITATYEQKKEGRTITGFIFNFKLKAKSKKLIASKRETNIPDVFHNMSDSQIATFSYKLANLPELGSHAPIGKSTAEFAAIIARELIDESKQGKYLPYLEKVGYRRTKQLSLIMD